MILWLEIQLLTRRSILILEAFLKDSRCSFNITTYVVACVGVLMLFNLRIKHKPLPMYVMLFKPNAKFIPCRMVYKQVDQDIPAQHLRMGQQVRQSARGWVNWGTLSALSSHRIWRFCLLMMGPSSSPWSTRKWIGEPHRLYYVCHLQETFRRDTAEMAPCWLYLVASFSHVFIIIHVKAIDQWPLTLSCIFHVPSALSRILVHCTPLWCCKCSSLLGV